MIGKREYGAADSLMDSIAQALGVPTERIIEFWLHRTPRGRSIITVRFNGDFVQSPPIQRVYQLTELPDAEHPPTPNPAAPIPAAPVQPIKTGPGAHPTQQRPPGWTPERISDQPNQPRKRRSWLSNQG